MVWTLSICWEYQAWEMVLVWKAVLSLVPKAFFELKFWYGWCYACDGETLGSCTKEDFDVCDLVLVDLVSYWIRDLYMIHQLQFYCVLNLARGLKCLKKCVWSKYPLSCLSAFCVFPGFHLNSSRNISFPIRYLRMKYLGNGFDSTTLKWWLGYSVNLSCY